MMAPSMSSMLLTLNPQRTMISRTLVIITFLLGILQVSAQIDGDNIFSQDQVIQIDLNFPDADFWNLLVANYNADNNDYLAAHLILTDVTGTYTIDSVGIRLKGNSSYSHPGNKKSFKIDFNEFISGQNYDGLKKLNFSNVFKDPSCMREKVFFDACQEAGVPAPRSSFANVNFNGTPWGLYTVIEQIDDQFLDWRILDDDGNLFKAGDNFSVGPGGSDAAADLLYYGADQSSYEERYELNTNEDINDWSDLIDFIDFINNSNDSEFQSGISNRLEWTEFLRSMALDNLFSNLDSYLGSARNYYIYHNTSTDKWEWVKWDANESFGSYANGVNNISTLALDYSDADRPLVERIFSDDVLYEQYLAEVCHLNETLFNSEIMDARIDEIKALIQTSVYADDNKMYTNAQFNTNIESDISTGGGPGGGVIYGLKSFIAQKSSYLSGALDCGLFTSLDEHDSVSLNLYPNPANEEVYFQVDKSIIQKIDLLDLQGRIIQTYLNLNTSVNHLELGDLPDGVYLIRFQFDNSQYTVRRLTIAK